MKIRVLAGLEVEALAEVGRRTSDSLVCLLDGNDGSARGRFSFLGIAPAETRVLEAGEADPLSFFEQLDRDRLASDALAHELLPGLTLGALPRWIGALSYDLAWACAAPLGLRRPMTLPRTQRVLAFFHRFEALVVGDRVTGTVALVGPGDAALDTLSAQLEAALAAPRAQARFDALATESRDTHGRAIEGALSLVRDGIVYQINLARRWSTRLEGTRPARALAGAMREASPVPYGALLELERGEASIVLIARSMERFLRWDRASDLLETRPIKGTIARDDAARDDTHRAALLADPKELAEHAMIVDLMRNDVGRLAAIGTVEVTRAFEVEPYARLHHLVSTVRARAREGVGLREVIAATFPPGSVTGTPKLSAIEHIEGLERFARGFYCGAVGHIDHAGGLDLAVSIRTAQLHGDELTYFAGGGLVDASVVEREIAETELKARVLEDALEALGARQPAPETP